MARSEPEYDTRGLEESIAHAKKNIETYRQAISIEETRIADYRKMIETLEKKKALSEGVVLDASA